MSAGLFPVRAIVADAALAGMVAGAMLLTVGWGRRRWRFMAGAVGTFVGFVAWNLTLNATHAGGFNTDAPLVGLSWADTGSGVVAFVITAAVLTLLDPQERASRVVVAAALAGVAAAVVDIFVL